MKYYMTLDSPVKEISKEDLKIIFSKEAIGEDFTNAFLMRTIIMNEKEYIDVDYERSLRELWYSTVKPTLDKLGLLSDDDQTEEGLTKWDATLSKYVAELVRGGYLTYQDLRILDTSRQKAIPEEEFYSVSSVYSYQCTVSAYPNILVVCEKDTVYSEVRKLARLFGCSCLSAKGQPAFAAIEAIVRGMVNVKLAKPFDTIYVVSFTDYDPAGYIIAEAVYTQISNMVSVLGLDLSVKRTRVGLEPSQLNEEQLVANWYSPKGANGHSQKSIETTFDNWFNLTGGVYGARKGLETEALPRADLRRLFVEGMFGLGIIDEAVYTEFVKKSYLTKVVLETVKNDFRWLTNTIVDKYSNKVTIGEEFDISKFASQGYSTIPISNVCSITDIFAIKSDIKKLLASGINVKAVDLLHRWLIAAEKVKGGLSEYVELFEEIEDDTNKLLGI